MTVPPYPVPSYPVPSYEVRALPGVPEVRPGDDLAALIAAASPGLLDGDVLLVTSKIVSKAEGRIVTAASREEAIDAETVRVVARRGPLRIVEDRRGLVMAAAGVDASNTEPGTVLLLPEALLGVVCAVFECGGGLRDRVVAQRGGEVEGEP
ncbi:coenzyme F420-0:L-glutamate ligase, partial [Streptomyces sp. NPDC048551]|uniref:coenzyme F420-0:L-glutamate ligase n=1 Tax=Streptomyces sp. NPDC048551 TaxID=3155758 RepID=UPI0034389656